MVVFFLFDQSWLYASVDEFQHMYDVEWYNWMHIVKYILTIKFSGIQTVVLFFKNLVKVYKFCLSSNLGRHSF